MPDYQSGHLGKNQKPFRCLSDYVFVSSIKNNVKISVAENNKDVLFICTAHSSWVSHRGSGGWFGEVLHDSVLSQGSSLGMEEPQPQWPRGAHGKLSIGNCTLALKISLPQKVSYFSYSHIPLAKANLMAYLTSRR